jgi:type VI secretion system protein ImpH
MGLTGPQGALPDHYTRLLIDRMRDDDQSMRSFFDLFNHRVISLFYRAWAKYRLYIGYERAARNASAPQIDPITHAFYSLIGFGTPHLRGRLELNDQTLLYYSGHLANLRPIAESLVRLLREYFQLPIRIDQFQGRWLSLSTVDQSCLGTATAEGGTHNKIGDSAMLGRRAWDVQSKFRVRLGPLNYRDFCSFLPLGRAFIRLCQLVRTYVGPEYDFDLQLVLTASEIPHCRIGGDRQAGSYLGWNAWLSTSPQREDADQTIFAGNGAPGHWRAAPPTSF